MSKGKNVVAARPAITVEGVSKTFRVPHERYNSLKQSAIHLFSKRSYHDFTAVSEVSFEVQRGEFFGIVGRNGCGKSTLLKMLAGIYIPSQGSIRVHGSLAPFIELGVGFNPELTARENVFLNGAILGLTRKEIAAKFDDVIKFAELEQFVDQKLKNFSSGMQVRLAFSISIQAESDILMVDEVLAVGDSSFQKKCFDVFRRLKKEGRTIVFVTHDMTNVLEFCDRVMVMNQGEKLALAGPEEATELYRRLNAENDLTQVKRPEEEERWGSGEVKIESLELMGASGRRVNVLKTGEPMTLRLNLKSELPKPEKLVVGLAFFMTDGTHMAGPNSKKAELRSDQKALEFAIDRVPFPEGTYFVTAAVYDHTGEKPFDYVNKGFPFAVTGPARAFGYTTLFGEWSGKK